MIKEQEIAKCGFASQDCIPILYANRIKRIVLDNISSNFDLENINLNERAVAKKLTRLICKFSDISFSSKMNKEKRSISRGDARELETMFQEILATKETNIIEFVKDKQLKYASFTYRILRPNKANDKGKIHYDNMFIEKGLQAPTTIKKARRYKVWIPIINDPGKNNLLISPYSHEEIRKHQANKDENGDLLSSYVDKYELKMVENKSFQPLIFSMNLLHGGSLNTYDELRISLEFEILIQDGK